MDEDLTIINTNTRNEKIKNFVGVYKYRIILSSIILLIVLIVIYGFDKYTNSKKKQILIETKNTFRLSNLAQFNRVIQLPKNKKKNIETIYFEIDKVLSTENFFIKKLILNKDVDKSKFEKIDISENIQSKNIDNINNWFDLKSLVRELLTGIN